jgi:hypothetical protein
VRDLGLANDRNGSRSEELDVIISGPLLQKRTLEQTCQVVAFELVAAIAAIR